MEQKNGMPWFKVRPAALKTIERRASGAAIKAGLFAAIAYFESAGTKEPQIDDLAAGMVFDAFRIGIDETLAARKEMSRGGKNSAESRKGKVLEGA